MSEETHTPLIIFIDAVRHQVSRTHDDKCGYGLAVALSNFEREKAVYDAAPELLEALQAVVAVADRKTVEFDKAHAAIAKATGAQR